MKKRLLLLLLCLTLLLTGCAAGKEQMPVFRIYGLSDTPGSDAISAVTVDWSGQKSLTVDRQAQAALEPPAGGSSAARSPAIAVPFPRESSCAAASLPAAWPWWIFPRAMSSCPAST